MENSIIAISIVSAFIAASSGLLGSFALLRRMALVGDALSHVALPGIALGILFNFNPFLGALLFLVLGASMIWFIEHKTRLPVDTLVGIFFSLALAIGAIFIPTEEIEKVFFGNIMEIRSFDMWLALTLSLLCLTLLVYFYRKFILTMISPDLSSSIGFKPHLFEFLFLLIFALVVAVGIKFAGALLMGPLIIIPAAISRTIARSMKEYLFLSAGIGVIGALLSITISYFYKVDPAPAFVIMLGITFFASIFIKRR